MNNIFDFKRFGLVLYKDMREHGKRYLLQFLMMCGVMSVILIWTSLDFLHDMKIIRSYYQTIEHLNIKLLGFSSLMFAGFGALMASSLMEPMNSKTKRISFLTSPSSNFEKYLSRWLIVTVGYTIAFFVALWISDALRVSICTVVYPGFDVQFIDLSRLFPAEGSDYSNYLFPEMILFRLILSIYLFVQSLFVLGAVFWEKASFIKTFATGVVISLLYLFLCNCAIQLFYETSNDFGNVINSFAAVVFLQEKDCAAWLFLGVLILIALLNWTLAFFRFRESEIIKRW